jgi:hypothetical protein
MQGVAVIVCALLFVALLGTSAMYIYESLRNKDG